MKSQIYLGSLFPPALRCTLRPSDGPQHVRGEFAEGHQAKSIVVHRFVWRLNPQTRVGVRCKALFDEHSTTDRKKSQAVSLIHLGLKRQLIAEIVTIVP